MRVREARPITLANASEPEPDISIVQDLGEVYATRHPQPGEILLVIEYAQSSLQKDTEIKRKIYAGAGIADYWVVDLNTRRLLVYRDPQNEDYQFSQALTTGRMSLLVSPEIAIDVPKLF